MKKLFTLILFLGLFKMGFGQVNFGIKGGLNFTTLGGNIDDAGLQIKLHAGGMVKLKLSEKVAFQPELLISFQGARDLNENGEFRLTYLNAPLVFRFMVSDQVSLHVGPQVGLLASSKYQRADGRVYNRPETSSTDAGLILGGAYHFNENLSLAAHYYHGMQNLNPDHWNSTLYNRVFQISIEYLFNSK